MKLSSHFDFNELTTTSDVDLLESNRQQAIPFIPKLTRVASELLEPIRVGMGKPLTVNSGFRGPALNAKVGGAVTSQHCLGEASDFNVEGMVNRAGQLAVIRWMLNNFKQRDYKFGQLLMERGCLHISLGTKCEVAEYDVPTKTKKPIPELGSANV